MLQAEVGLYSSAIKMMHGPINIRFTVMSIKYYQFRLVHWSVVVCSDAHGRYIRWTVIHTGERWCCSHSGLFRNCHGRYAS